MPTLDEVKAVVDSWFTDRIAVGPIAHHTPAYNQAYFARDDLKARLSALFGVTDPEPAPAPEPEPEPEAQPKKKPATDATADKE